MTLPQPARDQTRIKGISSQGGIVPYKAIHIRVCRLRVICIIDIADFSIFDCHPEMWMHDWKTTNLSCMPCCGMFLFGSSMHSTAAIQDRIGGNNHRDYPPEGRPHGQSNWNHPRDSYPRTNTNPCTYKCSNFRIRSGNSARRSGTGWGYDRGNA